MNRSIKNRYEFGHFCIHTGRRTLLRDGEIVPLRPKTFDVLLALIERGGEVVKRSELMTRVWPDSYVEESNLSYNISTLRKALGERPNEHQYITTVPGHGYMFVAKVRKTLEANINEVEERLVNLPLINSTPQGHLQDKTIDSLAVLPLTNPDSNPNTEYLSDGITDTIINNLSQLSQLRVLAHNTVFQYKGCVVNAQEAGRELGVRSVLLGQVIQFSERLIVKTELVDVTDGRQLWGAKYNRQMSDIFEVEEEISQEISEALRLKLTGEQKQRLIKRYTKNTEAYNVYLKGRYHWNKFTREGAMKGIAYFEQAIEVDPQYALAHAAISDSYYRLSNLCMSPQEAMSKAKASALKAVELDDTLAEAHTAIAVVKDQFDWDWDEAEREYRLAIECNPNCIIAYQRYSRFLTRMGRFDEAFANLQIAMELDPLSFLINVSLGSLLLMMRRYDQSIELFERVLEMNPNYYPACYGLAQVYQFKGELDKAIIEYQKALSTDDSLEILGRLGQAYAMAGKMDETLKIISQMKEQRKQQYVSPYCTGLVYAGLGDNDQAFLWLEKAFDERNEMVTWLRVQPELDSLRSDPRFMDLLQRVGLEPKHFEIEQKFFVAI